MDSTPHHSNPPCDDFLQPMNKELIRFPDFSRAEIISTVTVVTIPSISNRFVLSHDKRSPVSRFPLKNWTV
jgi:hypothetical protein